MAERAYAAFRRTVGFFIVIFLLHWLSLWFGGAGALHLPTLLDRAITTFITCVFIFLWFFLRKPKETKASPPPEG